MMIKVPKTGEKLKDSHLSVGNNGRIHQFPLSMNTHPYHVAPPQPQRFFPTPNNNIIKLNKISKIDHNFKPKPTRVNYCVRHLREGEKCNYFVIYRL